MEGMANIQKLAKQALKTFRVPSGVPSKQNLDILKVMLEKMTAEDINIKVPSKGRRRSFGSAPVVYVDILECPYFSLVVFIVNKGKSLPLHNHPGMFGLCKVLYGSIQVKTYDKFDSEGHEKRTSGALPIKNKIQKVVFHGEPIFDSMSDACIVSPSHGNYHSITAVDGTAAFLDILGPPYASEKGRDCTYYKECQSEKNCESDAKYLMEVPCPPEFFCDSQAYKGPVVDLKKLIEDLDDT